MSFPGLELNTIDRGILSQMKDRIAAESTGTLHCPDRIYVSRERAQHRKVVNEDSLRRLLEDRFGFTTLYMEDYSVSEQMALFSRAGTIVAVHGPSLTNVIGCRSSTLVELSNEHHLISCYYRLANTDGNQYVLVKCRNTGDPQTLHGKAFYGYADIEVDLPRLEKLLAGILTS